MKSFLYFQSDREESYNLNEKKWNRLDTAKSYHNQFTSWTDSRLVNREFEVKWCRPLKCWVMLGGSNNIIDTGFIYQHKE